MPRPFDSFSNHVAILAENSAKLFKNRSYSNSFSYDNFPCLSWGKKTERFFYLRARKFLFCNSFSNIEYSVVNSPHSWGNWSKLNDYISLKHKTPPNLRKTYLQFMKSFVYYFRRSLNISSKSRLFPNLCKVNKVLGESVLSVSWYLFINLCTSYWTLISSLTIMFVPYIVSWNHKLLGLHEVISYLNCSEEILICLPLQSNLDFLI